jgi:hypothetical protein
VKTTDIEKAVKIEDAMYEARVESKEINDEPHKRSGAHPAAHSIPEVGQRVTPLESYKSSAVVD